VQRKVFRVEQTFGGSRAVAPSPAAAAQRHMTDELRTLRALAEDTSGEAVQTLKRELASVRKAIAHNKRELAALIGEGQERPMARAAGELGAAINGMEKATVKILKSAEVIDDCAKAVAFGLKTGYERGLAQDVQDHVVHIYEACNFQDLAGQRIGNVIGTLNEVEEQVAAMLERYNEVSGKAQSAAPAKSSAGSGLLNGPRLDGDSGHASQRDVDKIFG
jgi:chemotaxis protein CheZ